MSKLRKILFVPDSHRPHHHKPSWNCMLRAGRLFKPDVTIIGGDFPDGDSISAHLRDRSATYSRLIDEVGPVNEGLDELESLGAKELHYIAGNHESRLERYIQENAPAFDGLVSWPQLLNLAKRGWSWTPYKKTLRIGKLNVTHDTGKAGPNAHRSAAASYMGSTVINHTHRLAYEVRGRIGRLPYLAAMFGWLGDPDKAATYTHEVNAHEMAHGFGLGWLDSSTGMVYVQPVPIINGRACVLGKLV